LLGLDLGLPGVDLGLDLLDLRDGLVELLAERRVLVRDGVELCLGIVIGGLCGIELVGGLLAGLCGKGAQGAREDGGTRGEANLKLILKRKFKEKKCKKLHAEAF